MSRSRRAAPARPQPAGPAPKPAPPLALSNPALLAVVLVATACILFTVTFRLIDSDFWQHLLVGRVMWERGAIPREHVWSWVNYGRPEVLPSWLFRWMLWPFYSAGGVEGLFAWRWITTLAAFGLAWATARRLGARGVLPLVVLAWCALAYRPRSQVRPETLAAVLMMAEFWILERVRQGRGRELAWLVPIAWVWSNAHVSYFIAFVLLAVHALGARVGRHLADQEPPSLARYAMTAGAMGVVALANPFGWAQLWQPFDYALHLSREPLFRGIGELQPLTLNTGWRHGLWLMILGWPVLALWRAWRHGVDWVELATCALATAYALPSQRFIGAYALIAAPFLGRDLETWVGDRRWPRWTAAAPARTGLAAAACVLLSVPEWRRPLLVPGIGVALERFPVAACDFMEWHGVRGRGFEHFRFVGYQAWRFWPDRSRLPFMDIHQSGSPADRAAFATAFTDPSSWPELTRRYRLDYTLLDRRQRSGAELLDTVDADSSWALVFLDDAAALYVRRASLKAVADSFGFHQLGGGSGRLSTVSAAAAADSGLRRELRAELERALAASRWNATANSLLANLEMAENRAGDARRRLEAALAVEPDLASAHYRLGMVALFEHRAQDAIAEFEAERSIVGVAGGLDLNLGRAYEQLGDPKRAREHYEAELERDPGNAAARARLDSLAGGSR